MAANDFGAELNLDMDWLKDLDSLEVPVENEGTDEEPVSQPAQSVAPTFGFSLADELEQAFGPAGAAEEGFPAAPKISKETTPSGQPKLEFLTEPVDMGPVEAKKVPLINPLAGVINSHHNPPVVAPPSTGGGILEGILQGVGFAVALLSQITEQNDQIIALLKGDTPDEDPLEEDPLPEPPVKKRRGKAKA